MKKHHSPRGKRSAFRLFAHALAAAAILSAGKVVVDHDGTASRKLGVLFNDTLMNSAKLGLGLSTLHADKSRTVEEVPEGMTIPEKKRMAAAFPLPKGVTRNGEDMSLAGKGSKALGEASQKAIVAAAAVDIYSK